MAWIELHQSLWTHRKTLLLADLLDVDETVAAGHLARFWTWTLDNSTDGTLPASARLVASAAGWRGDRDRFFHALQDAGWLDAQGDNVAIHNWERYMGRLMAGRARNAERARTVRATSHIRGAHGTTLQNRTEQNHTEPNQTEPPPTVEARASAAPELPAMLESDPPSISKPKRRDLTIAAIAELQAEMPGVDMDAAARDYLNWSGSAKHVDKVQGLRNQLREEWRRKKFARSADPGEYGVFRAVNPEPDVGDSPPAFVDNGLALARNRAWRQVVSKLEADATERQKLALRGAAWIGMEGNMAIVETRRGANADALDEISGLIAVWLRDACPDTEIAEVVVRAAGAQGGVA